MRASKPANPYMEIPLEQVDPPALPMRETFDEEKLDELTESIKKHGVILPVIVKLQPGGRYEITDGHRRFVCSSRAGLTKIPAIIRTSTDGASEALKVAANFGREDVNAGELAVYLAELLAQHCHDDVDELCALTALKRGFVEDRLLLLRGDGEVLSALKDKRINFAVARELNLVQNTGLRRSFMEAAIAGGASGRLVAEWRRQAQQFEGAVAPDTNTGIHTTSALPAPITQMQCFICDGTDEPWTLEFLYAHRRCRQIFLERFLQRIKGVQEELHNLTGE